MAQSPTSIVENRRRDCPFSDRIKNDLSSSFRRLHGTIPGRRTLLVPLAVPLLAGPSTLAMLILLSSNAPEKWMSWLLAVILAWLLTSVVMICSGSLLRLLGEKGLVAVERLMGMVLVTLSVQMLLDGFSDYLRKLLESS